MAKFKLYLLTTNSNTNDSNGQIQYIKTLISSFVSQEELYEQNKTAASNDLKDNFCYTQNEKLSKHKHAQQELDFEMARRVINQNIATGDLKNLEDPYLNPFVDKIFGGSTLILEDKYGNERFFTVTDISYKLGALNIIYTYKCQDSFTYQLSRQNNGYTIKNDYTSEDFIGVKDIDHWVVENIHPECKIMYDYITMNQELIIDSADHPIISDEINYTRQSELTKFNTTVKKVVKPIYNSDWNEHYESFYDNLLFEVSGSSAKNALISLGEKLGLMLNVYEKFLDGNLIRKYWFEPMKNPISNGLYYSPTTSIKDLSLSAKTDSLTTVLNISSVNINDEEVGLFPPLPTYFSNIFLTDPNWAKHYEETDAEQIAYPHIFSNLFKKEVDGDLGSRNPGASFSIDNTTYYYLGTVQQNAANYLVKFDGNKENYTVQIENLVEQDLYVSLEDPNDAQKKFLIHAGEQDNIKNFLTSDNLNKQWIVRIYTTKWDSSIAPTICTLVQSHTPNYEEAIFAEIGDDCPWLENKLIDFSYFYSRKIITENEYLRLLNLIRNDLRICNGKLMTYAKEYFEALHNKTKIIAELQEQVDSMGAIFNSEIVDTYRRTGAVGSIDNVISNYNLISTKVEGPAELFQWSQSVSYYFSMYFNAYQRFLRNIKSFIDYFNEPCTFSGTGYGSYLYTIARTDNRDDDFLGFNPEDQLEKISNPQVLPVNSRGKLIYPIYEKKNDVLKVVPHIHLDNYKEAYYKDYNLNGFVDVAELTSITTYSDNNNYFLTLNDYNSYNSINPTVFPKVTTTLKDGNDTSLVKLNVQQLIYLSYRNNPDYCYINIKGRRKFDDIRFSGVNGEHGIYKDFHPFLTNNGDMLNLRGVVDRINNPDLYSGEYTQDMIDILKNSSLELTSMYYADGLNGWGAVWGSMNCWGDYKSHLPINYLYKLKEATINRLNNNYKEDNDGYRTIDVEYNVPRNDLNIEISTDTTREYIQMTYLDTKAFTSGSNISGNNTELKDVYCNVGLIKWTPQKFKNQTTFYDNTKEWVINAGDYYTALSVPNQDNNMSISTTHNIFDSTEPIFFKWNNERFYDGVTYINTVIDSKTGEYIYRNIYPTYSFEADNSNNNLYVFNDFDYRMIQEDDTINYSSKLRLLSWGPDIDVSEDNIQNQPILNQESDSNAPYQKYIDYLASRYQLYINLGTNTYDNSTKIFRHTNSWITLNQIGNENTTIGYVFSRLKYYPLEQIMEDQISRYYLETETWSYDSTQLKNIPQIDVTEYLSRLGAAKNCTYKIYYDSTSHWNIIIETSADGTKKHLYSLIEKMPGVFVNPSERLDANFDSNDVFNFIKPSTGVTLHTDTLPSDYKIPGNINIYVGEKVAFNWIKGANLLINTVADLSNYEWAFCTNKQIIKSFGVVGRLKYNYNPVYTVAQLEALDKDFYKFTTTMFKTYELFDRLSQTDRTTDSFDVPLFLYHKTNNGDFKIIKSQGHYQLTFERNGTNTGWNNLTINETHNGINYESTFTVTEEEILSFNNLTNGEFWYLNKDDISPERQVLFNHAALIETNLTTYWDIAYNASLNAMYFLPQYWQQNINQQVNNYPVVVPHTKDNFNLIQNSVVTNLPYQLVDDSDLQSVYVDFLETFTSDEPLVIISGKMYIYDATTLILTPKNIFSYFDLTIICSELGNVNGGQIIINNTTYAITQTPVTINCHITDLTNPIQIEISTGCVISLIQINTNAVFQGISINNELVPQVRLFQAQNGRIDLPMYTYSFINDEISDGTYNEESISEHNTIDPASDLFLCNPLFFELIQHFNNYEEVDDQEHDKHSDEYGHWKISAMNGTTKYYQVVSGGVKWGELANYLGASRNFENMDGNYGMMYSLLRNKYKQLPKTDYEKQLEVQNNLWRTLYKQYPFIFLENVYSNDELYATPDASIYEVYFTTAKQAFQDLSYPQYSYNISVIDYADLKGYTGEELHIGDSIKVDAAKYIKNTNLDIYKALQEYLFITDISYNLRQENTLSLTVDNVKYEDKLIDMLADLIGKNN